MCDSIRKNKKILIIVLTFVFVILVYGSFKLITNKDSDEQETGFNEELKDILKEINIINKVFTSKELSENSAFVNDSGFNCYRYLGSDKEIIIESMEKFYKYPFKQGNYFKILMKSEGQEDNDKDLYVCVPNECTMGNIDVDNASVVKDNGDSKVISINDNEYVINNNDGKWQFSFPIVICK